MNFVSLFLGGNQIFLLITLAWSIFWKGIALWRAAQSNQRNWYIVILFVSIFGLIEIAYLFWFAKKRLTLSEMSSWIQR